jgi:hypothetical protein
MQQRLGQGPHVVFGLETHAEAEDIRTAFLALTKVYHPAKFARMSVEVQRQSNEVFLGIKAALDLMNKAVQMPAAGTGRFAAAPRQGPNAPLRPISQPIPTIQQKGRPVTPQTATATPIGRPGTPPTAVAQPVPRPTPQHLVAHRPAPARSPGTSRGSAAMPVLDEKSQIASAFDLIEKQQWDGAKSVLDALTARAPDSRQVRALVCYAEGRRAQVENRIGDARVELNQALMIDPDLAPAKSALAELFARRK